MSLPKLLPGKFVWFELVCRDPKAAQAFYGEVLGWKTVPVPMGKATYEMIYLGDTMIGGYASPMSERESSHWLSYVSVDDVDASAKAAAAKGGKVVLDPFDVPGAGRMARIADPQGAELATGNNISLKGDTARRVLLSRMVSPLENPEDRDDFRHTPLIPWVKANRARLVVAGLTILRAYVADGRPRTSVKTWGSFESWSSLVAASIVWAGGADPQLARPVEADEVNPEKSLLQRLLASFPPVAFTAKELTVKADERKDGDLFKSLVHPELHDVLEEIAPRAERGDRLKRVGQALYAWKDRVVDGKHLVAITDKRRKLNLWSTVVGAA